MIRPIIKDIDFLRQISIPIAKDEDTSILQKDMEDTMRHHNALGIAAIQIGIPKRIFMIDLSLCDDLGIGDLLVARNPVIDYMYYAKIMVEEGCLSIPITKLVERYTKIYLHLDDGSWQKYTGLTAIAIQHEYDHLDGKLIIDQSPTNQKFIF